MSSESALQVDEVLEFLEKMKSRPRIIIGSDDNVHDLDLFFQGFDSACIALGYRYGVDIERQILIEHGWERRAQTVTVQMLERGLDGKSIVQEFLMLEIEKWKKFKEQASELG
jgi:hypothetical protein